MKIEVVAEDKNIGTINCESMYQAHTWVVYLNANGFKCKTLVMEYYKIFQMICNIQTRIVK